MRASESELPKPIQVEKRKGKGKAKATPKAAAPANSIEGRAAGAKSGRLVLELGIFVDEAMLKLYMPFFAKETSDREQQYVRVKELVLAFVNGMQVRLFFLSQRSQVEVEVKVLDS